MPTKQSLKKHSSLIEIGIIVLLIVLFFTKNSFLAFFGPPWYGEDELAHFGYIETLARTNQWYSLEDNFASEESFRAREHYNQSADKRHAIKDIENGQFQSLRNTPSSHYSTTAYQPPLYYWLMAKVYQSFNTLNVLTLLYLFREINVLISVLTLIVAYLLARSLIQGTTSRLIFMSFLAFHPLYSFLTSSVTNHSMIIMLATLVLTLLYFAWNNRWSALTTLALVFTLILGLLTQQMFLLFVPLILCALIYDLVKKRFTLSYFLALLITFIVGGIPLIPQYVRRHQETQYTVSATAINAWNPMFYVTTQLPRLKEEYFTGFWIQVRSFIPYYAPQPLVNFTRTFTLIAIIGLSIGFARKLFDTPTLRWVTLALGGVVMLLLTHLVLDYLQFHLSAQEYFKGRYFYILLIPIAALYTFGWKSLLKTSRWYSTLSLSLIVYFIIFNLSAILWLTTKLPL